MNSHMEEAYEKPRQCGWKILKDAMERAYKKDEEEQAGGRMKELVDRMKCEANFKARLKRIYLSKKQK